MTKKFTAFALIFCSSLINFESMASRKKMDNMYDILLIDCRGMDQINFHKLATKFQTRSKTVKTKITKKDNLFHLLSAVQYEPTSKSNIETLSGSAKGLVERDEYDTSSNIMSPRLFKKATASARVRSLTSKWNVLAIRKRERNTNRYTRALSTHSTRQGQVS